MTVPLRIGTENPEEENQFIEELNIARDEKLEQISYHLINSGDAPAIDSIFRTPSYAQFDPQYLPIMPLQLIEPVPGAITWFPSAPYSYRRITQGATLCWASSTPQMVDAQNGRILLRACSDPANPTTDNAYGQLGTIITVAANQKAEVLFSWVADVKLDWSLRDPGAWVNLGVGIMWEVWSFNTSPAPGQKVKEVNANSTFGHTWSPTGSSWGLKGSRKVDLVPTGHSNVLSRAVIYPPSQATTFCVFLDVWLQVNSGGGAIELDLRLTQPA